MILQNKVKEFRMAKGLSGLELSRQASIAPSTVHNIENFKIPVYPAWRKRIAAALGELEKDIFPEEA